MNSQTSIDHPTIPDAVAIAKLPSEFGSFKIYGYSNSLDNSENVAIVKGDPQNFQHPVMVRIHSECLTGDALGSLRCDCRAQLHIALKMIEDEGQGIVIYLQQEGRGIGLINKLKAYSLQDQGLDTVQANEHLGFAADLRDYGMAAHILQDLGLQRIRLITNNPLKISHLRDLNIEIDERIPLTVAPNNHNLSYLKTKVNKMGHLVQLEAQHYTNQNQFKIDDALEDIWPSLLSWREHLQYSPPRDPEIWALYGNIHSPWHFQAFTIDQNIDIPTSDFLILIHLANDIKVPQLSSDCLSQNQSILILSLGTILQKSLIQNFQCIKGSWDTSCWRIFCLYLRILIIQRQYHLEKRAFLMAHLAQSLDGKIAAINGDSRWLSNEANLIHAHRLRALHDAVMVGATTATLDNPRLTVRLVAGNNPAPIIIEGNSDLELDETKMEILQLHQKVIILYPQGKAHRPFSQSIQEKVLFLPVAPSSNSDAGLCLEAKDILQVLYENGIHSIFLEGGGRTVSHFLRSACLELMHLHVSPLILGSGRPSFRFPVIESIADGLRFEMNPVALDQEILFELLPPESRTVG